MFSSRYYEYIQSDWWKKTRDEAIKDAGNKCFCCGRPFDLQVHHLTYDHIGFERSYELVVLCKNCHNWIEEHKRVQDRLLTRQEQEEILLAYRDSLNNKTVEKVLPKNLLMEEFGKAYYFRDYSRYQRGISKVLYRKSLLIHRTTLHNHYRFF